MKEEQRFQHFIIINDKDAHLHSQSLGGQAVAARREGGKRLPYGSGEADGAVRGAVRILWLLSITHVTSEPARRKTTGVHDVINELSTATRQNMMPIVKPPDLSQDRALEHAFIENQFGVSLKTGVTASLFINTLTLCLN